ncbi:MAG TPA: arginine--tRNA ligase, partial [Clostridia bacterium]|nr:arginine--tRNA ligase [Clostridia bacterium]
MILKSDGASLYTTRDIAAAIYRKETYDFHKCLYVVAYHQNLHFQQFFKVIELMGYSWADSLEHVAFGMVSMEDGTMSTRKGKVVYLEELLNRAVAKTLDIINEKSPDLEDKEEVAKKVGIGAVVFNALYNNRIKDYVFSWDRALNFDGESGPYVQYTHARCTSVLAKGGGLVKKVNGTMLTDRLAQDVIKLLAATPDIIKEAAKKYEPSLLTRHLADIAKAYNKFYYENRILEEDEDIRNSRLALTAAVQTVLKTGLGLLGIAAPEKM